MNLSEPLGQGDSTVILCSLEHTAREVKILNFHKVEVVQSIDGDISQFKRNGDKYDKY